MVARSESPGGHAYFLSTETASQLVEKMLFPNKVLDAFSRLLVVSATAMNHGHGDLQNNHIAANMCIPAMLMLRHRVWCEAWLSSRPRTLHKNDAYLAGKR